MLRVIKTTSYVFITFEVIIIQVCMTRCLQSVYFVTFGTPDIIRSLIPAQPLSVWPLSFLIRLIG